MQKNKFLRFFAMPLLIFCFAYLPLRFSNPSAIIANFAGAESEEYPGEIEGDVTWGDEHAIIGYDVTIFEDAILTLSPGSHDFQGRIDMYPGADLILEGGEYFFRKGLSANGGDVVLKKGDYTIEGDFGLNNGSKLTVEPGTHIKFKKSGEDTPGLSLTGSTFIASGTIEEMIVFEGADENSSEYYVSIEGNNNDTSEIRYANFIGGGMIWGTGGEAFLRDLLVKTAYAADQFDGIPTLKIINSNISIENSKFEKNNYYAIESDIFVSAHVWNPETLRVSNSDFVENANKLAVKSNVTCEQGALHCSGRVVLTNNYYDSSSGPKYEYNPGGTGNEVIGPVDLESWNAQSNFTPVVPTPSGPSNVLFLPGLEASRLYDGGEKLWEPENNGEVEELYLNSNGGSINEDVHAKEADVIDYTPIGSGIYGSFIEQMNNLKSSGEINDWKPIAYDWRMPLDDIVDDNSLIDKIRDLANGSKSKKVTIIAHSNGGLLAKELMLELGSEETKKLIDKVIFVAVPQVGTPDALAAMLHGYKQSIFPVLSARNARGLAVNMSSVYNLLPSDPYFTTVHNPVITFDKDVDESDDWKDRYDDEIKSEDTLDDFLLDDFRRVLANGSEINIPALLNGYLLDNARAQQEALNGWTIPDGVKVVQIAGWGVDKTVKSIGYKINTDDYTDAGIHYVGVDLLEPEMDSTIDGDGTVVTPSALWMGGAERYWVNMAEYNRLINRISGGRIFRVDHSDILEIKELVNFIKDSVEGDIKPLSNYTYLSTEVPPGSDKKRLQYTLHSPLTLDLYDEQGHHTGINEEGNVEEEIPGTYYSEIGDVKYIFSDEDFSGQIRMKGYENGKFTFSVKEYQGDTETGKITFKDMPTTEQTEVFFNVPDGLESASNLKIDKDGDDDIDYSFESKIDEVVTLDMTPPVTESSLAGAAGENGWYVDDASVLLSASDDEKGSGIEKTEYSLDGGVSWQTYNNQIDILQEGITNLEYFSTDKQGNVEEIKIAEIKIDKTAPEAKISFDKDNQKLKVEGKDNLSQNVSVSTVEKAIVEPQKGKEKHGFWPWGWFLMAREKKIVQTTTLTDEAGHHTEIVLEKKKDRNGFIDLIVQSVSYDDQDKIALSNNRFQYKWLLNWWGKKYPIFASHIKTQVMMLESHYLQRIDQTWIMERPSELSDDDSDSFDRRPVRKKMPGMVIPGIITSKGELQVIY